MKLRYLFIVLIFFLSALVYFGSMLQTDEGAVYHETVKGWTRSVEESHTIWYIDGQKTEDTNGGIVYMDRDGDGRIDSRAERVPKKQLIRTTMDKDGDGIFDEEWTFSPAQMRTKTTTGVYVTIAIPVPVTE